MSINKPITKRISALVCALALLSAWGGASASASAGASSYSDTGSVIINIDTSSGHKNISPYIYGISAESGLDDMNVNAVKQSDKRVSVYNWENNYSRGGGRNTQTLIVGYPANRRQEPGLYADSLVSLAKRYGISSKYVTLQITDFTAGGMDGALKKVLFHKTDGYLSTPDTEDDSVYMDEYVSYLVNRYGYAADGGINGYFLGNEPENYSELYPDSMEERFTAEELVSRSSELAYAVKKIDPTALVYGPSLSGIESYINMGNSDDWDKYSSEYSWYIDYYLDSMRRESDTMGIRLLDVLDLHYQTEAVNGLSQPVIGSSAPISDGIRMQAPRILWDSSYTENSTAALMHNQHIPLIPTLEASINMYYPGTKLSFSEYNFGGGNVVSGGVAEADVLGIFASHGIHMACARPDTDDISYIKSAINIYTNYDGEGGRFGNTLVRADNGGDIMSSVYASVSGSDESLLKVIMINKNQTAKKSAEINIKSEYDFSYADIYSFNGDSPEIVKQDSIDVISGNSLTIDLEPMSVYMMVLDSGDDDDILDDYTVTEETSMTEDDSGGEVTDISGITEPAVSEHEHVEASTYSPAPTTEDFPDDDVTEAAASVTSVKKEEPDIEDTETATDAETDPAGDEQGHVPAGIKAVVSVLVAAVVLVMGYILVNDYLLGKNKKG
ncbi:MAG: hypothetical protein J1F11_03070 [Oscillospiraceae bacterium]|nr:hypothetical protein [Oscillospiraceae bacterium]